MSWYAFDCPDCGRVEIDRSITIGVQQVEPCPTCGQDAWRIYEAPFFTEDRLRFHKTPDAPTDNWSWAAGAPMPQSRQERKRLEKEKGIEFVGKSDWPETWKTAMDYHKHVDSGGERLPPEVIMPTKLPKSNTTQRIKAWRAEQKEKRKITLNP